MRRGTRFTFVAAIVSLLLLAASGAAQAAPNDPLWAEWQWGPRQIKAQNAWTKTKGAGITIGIVDAGIDLGHPDLDAKVIAGRTFLECGKAGCGNGDWESGPAARRATKSVHGTHVAGIAGAETGNGVGISGVAPSARLLAVKVIDEDGGTTQDVALGVDYARTHGAKVINLSLGGLPGEELLVLAGLQDPVISAIKRATNAGITVVVSAGNDSYPLCENPAIAGKAICVVATDSREARSFYSSGGIKPDMLSVAAPGGSAVPICGEDIVSTVPVGESLNGDTCGYGANYDEIAGTSMAAPHVAGVAALLRAQGRSAANTLEAITKTARQPGTGTRGTWTPLYGYGIVDAAAAANYHK
jgi:subtilisin family serine protease